MPNSGRRSQRQLPAAGLALLVVLLFGSEASANSAMGLKGLAEIIFLFFGVALWALSAALGAVSWITALRPPNTVGWVFGRGFLGVSAVLAFGFGALFLLMGAESSAGGKTSATLFFLAVTLTTLFLVVEFAIAGRLYWRANQHKRSTLAKVLSLLSFGLAAAFGLGGVVIATLGAAFANEDDSKPHLTSETRRYIKGCEDNKPNDCNMLGLRYQHGSGLPPDLPKAAAAFQKSCDLKFAVACDNLARMYAKGDGVPKDAEKAKQLRSRAAALSKGP
ncbi:MAG: hypothetical protein AB7K71_22005 [Polyangiaceae bacterium]